MSFAVSLSPQGHMRDGTRQSFLFSCWLDLSRPVLSLNIVLVWTDVGLLWSWWFVDGFGCSLHLRHRDCAVFLWFFFYIFASISAFSFQLFRSVRESTELVFVFLSTLWHFILSWLLYYRKGHQYENDFGTFVCFLWDFVCSIDKNFHFSCVGKAVKAIWYCCPFGYST